MGEKGLRILNHIIDHNLDYHNASDSLWYAIHNWKDHNELPPIFCKIVTKDSEIDYAHNMVKIVSQWRDKYSIDLLQHDIIGPKLLGNIVFMGLYGQQ